MRKLVDLTGQVFGRLTVIKRVGTYKAPNGSSMPWWLCRCLCGREKTVLGMSLKNGDSKSCGCEQCRSKHGHSPRGNPSATYNSFQAMRQRCLNPNATSYLQYGDNGVTVCDRWNPEKGGSFENFLSDLGEKPEGTSLGRFNDIGNYEPGNVAWQTWAEQVANRRPDRVRSWSKKKSIEPTAVISPTISPAQQVSL